MQRIILLLFMATASWLVACKKSSTENEEPGSLIGKWKLKETRVSPGTPVINFTPVNYEAYVEFKANGEVVWSGQQQGFRFDRYEVLSDSTLKIVEPAIQPPIPYRYKATTSKLTLNPPCDEECTYRYVRISGGN